MTKIIFAALTALFLLGCGGGDGAEKNSESTEKSQESVKQENEVKKEEKQESTPKEAQVAPEAIDFMNAYKKQDYITARKLAIKACASFSETCKDAENIFENGLGGPKDDNKTFTIEQLGCKHGKAENCINIAWRYSNASGVEKDLNKSLEFAKLACELDYKTCQDKRVISPYSISLKMDDKEGAIEFYKQKCDGAVKRDERLSKELGMRVNDAKDCYIDLGKEAYELGFKEKAAEFFELAQKSSWDIQNIGEFYESNKDYKVAQELYRKHCDLGDSYSCANLSSLAERGLIIESE